MVKEIFSVESISAGYGKKNVLSDVSFSINSGEFVSLIGPNGAGKSTIIRSISGSIPSSGGRVLFSGIPVDRYSRRELASRMALVSQLTGEIPDFTVLHFLSLGLFPHMQFKGIGSGCNDLIIDTASICGVEHLLDRSIGELSTGEFQLVQIARALIQNRDLLLLDEPVSNLDYRHMVQVMGILKSLNGNGATIICALHDLNIAVGYSSRVIAVKNGSIFFDGRPRDVVSENSLKGLYETEFRCGTNPVTGLLSVYPVPGL